MSEEVTDFQRNVALRTLLRYLLAEKPTPDFDSQKILANNILQVSETDLKNFLTGQKSGKRSSQRDGGNITVKKIFSQTKNYMVERISSNDKLPSFVISMYHEAFSEEEFLIKRRAVSEIGRIILSCNLDSHRRVTKILEKEICGNVYDVYRWTSFSNNNRDNKNPRAIRASMTFKNPSQEGNFIEYEIHYKPFEKGPRYPAKPDKSSGFLVPVGDHIYFIGCDERFSYPLIMIGQINTSNVERFSGLVVRRADTKGDIFTSRVAFLKNEITSKIEDLDNEICILKYKELSEENIILLDTIRNEVEFDGREALSYLPL